MDNNIEIIHKISENIKFVSILTIVTLCIIIVTNFLPMMHWSIDVIGKFIALIILMYSIKLNVINSNNALNYSNNIFTDPNKKDLRNMILLSYVFSIFLFILLGMIIHSLFNYI